MGFGPRFIRTTTAFGFGLSFGHTTLTSPLPRLLHSFSKRYQVNFQATRTAPSLAMSSYAKEPVASSTAHTGTLANIDLSGYNFEQAKLMDERCIIVDENDKPLGALDKKTCGSLR